MNEKLYHTTMQAKIHIIIVSAIILVIFLIWYVMYGNIEQKQPIVVSGYAIEVSRATYGAECNSIRGMQSASDPYSTDKQDIYKENNVLKVLQTLCNGKVTCNVDITDSKLDFQATKNCMSKNLEVEYRCFKVDRIRRVSGYEGTALSIDCQNI